MRMLMKRECGQNVPCFAFSKKRNPQFFLIASEIKNSKEHRTSF